MNNKTAHQLQNILDHYIDNKKIFGTSFCIKHNDAEWSGSSGNLHTTDRYFIASTTKLFVTALILLLKKRGMLELEDHIDLYLDEKIVDGIHTYQGADYSRKICIKKLLAHTSGIPDYFQQKSKDGQSLESDIKSERDRAWSFEDAVMISKSLDPIFAPGSKGKAHYSDTNFQLLGKIVENITEKSFSENVDELICKPLGLRHTYVYNDINDQRPRNMYYQDNELHIPRAMSSFGPDGGVVSTSADMMVFLNHFFNGTFFSEKCIKEMQVWNKIFYPMKSGIGIHLFRLPWYFNPFGGIPDFIGHSGLSGALAYYLPEKNIYITGTVNQIARPDLSFRLAVRLVQCLLKSH